MALPKIKHCIVCEDARPEANKLATILGFFGIAPDVEILLKDFEKPVRQLTFLLMGGHGQLRGKISVRIFDMHGRPVIDTPMLDIDKTAPEGKNMSLIFSFGNVHFRQAGEYKVIFMMDGQQFYDNTFAVALGQPGDFTF